MPRSCHNRPLGTTPNAKIRIRTNIRTPRAAAPCGSVVKIARKDVEKCDHAALARFGSVFRLFWG
jgi:hypothetical protein